MMSHHQAQAPVTFLRRGPWPHLLVLYSLSLWGTSGDALSQASPSRVFWTPWLGSTWRGNLYDYRGAFFQDVMYSNARPYQEGCLLYSDAAASEQMSLVYQRYAKFDDTTLAVPNATYFNLHGAPAMRLGRYQIPLSEHVDLRVQVPLTRSQIKGYLNAPGLIKWFVNAQMQRNRDRSYPLRASFSQQGSGKVDTGSLFRDAIFAIEYGRIFASQSDECATLSIQPHLFSEDDKDVTVSETRGLVVSMETANSQYFLETLIQATLNYFLGGASLAVLVVADDHSLSKWASEVTVRIAAANGAQKVMLLVDCDANTAVAEVAQTLASKPGSSAVVAFLWSGQEASEFRLQLLIRPTAGITFQRVEREEWLKILATAGKTTCIKFNGAISLTKLQNSG